MAGTLYALHGLEMAHEQTEAVSRGECKITLDISQSTWTLYLFISILNQRRPLFILSIMVYWDEWTSNWVYVQIQETTLTRYSFNVNPELWDPHSPVKVYVFRFFFNFWQQLLISRLKYRTAHCNIYFDFIAKVKWLHRVFNIHYMYYSWLFFKTRLCS